MYFLVACRGFEPPRRVYETPMQPITPSRPANVNIKFELPNF